jgi:hypothetical protein
VPGIGFLNGQSADGLTHVVASRETSRPPSPAIQSNRFFAVARSAFRKYFAA